MPARACLPPDLEPDPATLRRARWLVGGWLMLSLAGLVGLALAAPTLLCR